MKKFVLYAVLIQMLGMPCLADNSSAKISAECGGYTYTIPKDRLDEAKSLNKFLADYFEDINSNNFKKLSNYYATNFISGDGFSKEQVLSLVKENQNKYKNLNYKSKILNLHFEQNRASVQISEDISAVTREKSKITNDEGAVSGSTDIILYLEKYGSGWKIVTDKTLYENIETKYGVAKNIEVDFDAPEQVFSGENYLVMLKTNPPANIFALGSLSSTPVEFQAPPSEETFKQIPSDTGTLERVIKVNEKSPAETASASVTFCEAQRIFSSIDMKVLGLDIVLRRVNVLHK